MKIKEADALIKIFPEDHNIQIYFRMEQNFDGIRKTGIYKDNPYISCYSAAKEADLHSAITTLSQFNLS